MGTLFRLKAKRRIIREAPAVLDVVLSKLTYIIMSAGVSFPSKFRTTLECLIAVGAANVLPARQCVFDGMHEHFIQTYLHRSFVQTNAKPQEWWLRNLPFFS